MRIPTVALGPERKPQEFCAELREAFAGCGFVAVEGHGLPAELIDAAYASMQRFFSLPAAVKLRYCVPGGAGQRGYTPFGKETGKDAVVADLKEFWHVGRERGLEGLPSEIYPPNLWPEEVPEFRPAMLGLYDALEELGGRVLAAVALSLGLAEDYFDAKVRHGNSILRPLHYPPITDAAGGVRAAEHEDINLITLLVGSHEPGLEILSRSGEWVAVTTLEGSIVCNVGDMLQRLSNHALLSTTHRVVNPPAPWSGDSRYSLPFFLHFNADTLITPLEGLTDRQPDPPITAQEYLQERLRELGLLP